MSYNWSIITNKLYGIIKGSSKNLKMYDAAGNETIDPDDATRFFATIQSDDPELEDFTILIAVHDQGQTSYINIKTPNLKNEVDFKRVYRIRNHIKNAIGMREGIKIIWQVFDQEIDPREEAVNNIKESRDVGRWFGTTKSSFQKIGEAKLVARHTDVINDETPGARARHIRALFVENKHGERFAYPHLHMSGARAFARHISNGGTNNDTIAESIKALSADYIGLRKASHMMRQNQVITEWIVNVRESMDTINRRLKSLHGPKGCMHAESILADTSVILDENANISILQKLSEACKCGSEDPGYNDLGVAAKYLGRVDQQMPPITFTWKRKPDITKIPANKEVLERLGLQISELADACSDTRASARLAEISNMITKNMKPTEEDIGLVREAIASSSRYVEETSVLPEEAELDSFLNEFAPENIFAEDNDVEEGYQVVPSIDTVRYQERAGLEGPFRTKSGKVVYYDPKEGKYYDPDSDFYIDHDDYQSMNNEGTIDSDYGVEQKQRERRNEIKYNNEQRKNRWNFGEPLINGNSADSDLEEMYGYDDDSNITYIQGRPGRVIANYGDYYLVHNPDRYDAHTVKNEYDVYKKIGDEFKTVTSFDMPYEHPSAAIKIFKNKYEHSGDEQLDEISSDTLKSYMSKAQQGNVPGFGGKGPFTDKDFRRSTHMANAQRIIRDKENPVINPKVHDFSDMDDGAVYDMTQTDDNIRDGDVLKLSGGRTGVLIKAWPTMVVGDSDALHSLNSTTTWKTMDRGRYLHSAELAKSISGDDRQMKETLLARIKNLAGI